MNKTLKKVLALALSTACCLTMTAAAFAAAPSTIAEIEKARFGIERTDEEYRFDPANEFRPSPRVSYELVKAPGWWEYCKSDGHRTTHYYWSGAPYSTMSGRCTVAFECYTCQRGEALPNAGR